jgi:hypothetical protein
VSRESIITWHTGNVSIADSCVSFAIRCCCDLLQIIIVAGGDASGTFVLLGLAVLTSRQPGLVGGAPAEQDTPACPRPPVACEQNRVVRELAVVGASRSIARRSLRPANDGSLGPCLIVLERET